MPDRNENTECPECEYLRGKLLLAQGYLDSQKKEIEEMVQCQKERDKYMAMVESIMSQLYDMLHDAFSAPELVDKHFERLQAECKKVKALEVDLPPHYERNINRQIEVMQDCLRLRPRSE